MTGIFVSYRREDSRADTGRLTHDLKHFIIENQIFRDIDTIEPGVDFTLAIEQAVGSCNVLLAIIGPQWLNSADSAGNKRLHNPDDYVHLEISTALNRDLRVIPVLVGDATMPTASELPDALTELSKRQLHELSEKRWVYDVEALATSLLKIPGIKASIPCTPAKRSTGTTGSNRNTTSDAHSPLSTRARHLGRFAIASLLSAMGVLFFLAGLIEGQALSFFWAAVFLGPAFWLFKRH